MVFRIRELLIRQRTQAINALRGHLGRATNRMQFRVNLDERGGGAVTEGGRSPTVGTVPPPRAPRMGGCVCGRPGRLGVFWKGEPPLCRVAT